MKTALIHHHPSNRRLMLIFSGWSTTPAFYEDLRAEGWDIMLVYDYTNLTFDPEPLRRYATIYILAWSLGVAAAECAAAEGNLHRLRISAAFAVNGTPLPAHDTYGIPAAIYHGTEAGLSPANLARFRRRMSAPSDPYQFPKDTPASIFSSEAEEETIERLRRELRRLGATPLTLLNGSKPIAVLPWKRAYISTADRIFPPDNQEAAWKAAPQSPQVVRVSAGHYLPLQMIINEIIPNHSRIGERFRRAADTYDANASAQEIIANHLVGMLSEESAEQVKSMMEIGVGSGALTRLLRERLNPTEAILIDLYPLPYFGIAPREEHVQADAEDYLDTVEPRSFDLIASASTMQWFADPERFFKNASRILKRGGQLLCSTFLPGNLSELDVLRPSPLIYRTKEELTGTLAHYFSDITVEEQAIPLDFNSPREALMHLKLTGVGGASKALTRNLLTALPPRPRLTYRALYIHAKR